MIMIIKIRCIRHLKYNWQDKTTSEAISRLIIFYYVMPGDTLFGDINSPS